MPKPRTGTVIYRPERERWRAVMSVPLSSGGRVRRSFDGKTREEALARMRAAFPEAASIDSAKPRRAIKENHGLAIAVAVLKRSREMSWTDEFTAAVLMSSITPSRMSIGVVGPCHYCGDELANTVDHVVPAARGGKHDKSNVVSCCTSCNISKGKLTVDEWRGAKRQRD